MRIRNVFIQDYKGIDAAIQWAGAVVLFGRNDAGKSNILESITSGAGLGGSREDPLRAGDQQAVLVALVELDQLDDEQSFDAELLAALLQVRHVPPLFPYIYAGEPLPDPQREQDLWGGNLYLSQFPASLLEWDHDYEHEETGSRQFKLGCVGPPVSEHMLNGVGSIAEARDALRERALEYRRFLERGGAERR